jgi:hypothetical protein
VDSHAPPNSDATRALTAARRPLVVLEIEEVVFATLDLRVRALHDALQRHGVRADAARLTALHRGQPAADVLSELVECASLDATDRELVLHATSAAVARMIREAPPAFDERSCARVIDIAAEARVAVVSRAARSDAHCLLESAELTPYVTSVRSLDGVAARDYAAVWSTLRHVDLPAVAVSVTPSALIAPARLAGYRTICIGGDMVPDADRCVESLHAASMATLLDGMHPEP